MHSVISVASTKQNILGFLYWHYINEYTTSILKVKYLNEYNCYNDNGFYHFSFVTVKLHDWLIKSVNYKCIITSIKIKLCSRASSHDATTIKKVTKIFSLVCKWSIGVSPTIGGQQ